MSRLFDAVGVALSATFFGVGAHICYLLILIVLPVQESGAARLGERFAGQ